MARSFGEALEAAIQKAGNPTATLIAKRSGIDESNISGYRNRQYPPTPVTVQKLAKGIGCDPLDLLDQVITKYGVVLCRDLAISATRDGPRSERRTATKTRAG